MSSVLSGCVRLYIDSVMGRYSLKPVAFSQLCLAVVQIHAIL